MSTRQLIERYENMKDAKKMYGSDLLQSYGPETLEHLTDDQVSDLTLALYRRG